MDLFAKYQRSNPSDFVKQSLLMER